MKVLQSYEFPAPVAKSRHNWQEWSDGKIRQFKSGEDFTSKPDSFATSARDYATKHGKSCRVSIDKATGTVTLQFVAKPAAAASVPPDVTADAATDGKAAKTKSKKKPA